MTLAYPGEGTSSLCEQIAKDYFIASLDDRDLELKIREREPRDLESAFKHAIRLEAYEKALNSHEQPKARGNQRREDALARKVKELECKVMETAEQKAPSSMPAALSTTGQRGAPRSDEVVEELKKTVSSLSQRNDELSKEVGRLRLLEEQRAKAAAAVPTPVPVVAPMPTQMTEHPAATSRPPPKCYFCGEQGHFIKDCRKKKAQCRRADADGAAARSAENHDSGHGQTYLRLYVNGQLRRCLLDTGSDVTLLPTSVALGVRLEPTSRRILAANGTAIKVTGSATVDATSGSHHVSITGLVSPHVHEVMLGIDFLKQQKAVWNFQSGEVVLNGHLHKLCGKKRHTWCRRVILQDDAVVPGKSEIDLSTLVQYGNFGGITGKECHSWVTETRQLRPGVCVSRTVVPARNDDVPVRVVNVSSEPVMLKAGTVVADLEAVQVCTTEEVATAEVNENQDSELVGMVDNVDSSVDDEKRSELLTLLTEFSGTFSRGEKDLGWTDVVTHSIDTGDSRPVRQPLRRHPPAHLDAIQQHVADMLAQEVIEPSKSPWASNIVLVKKKDGTLRCCIDYRQVNAVTKKDAYPLPRTDMCLDAMAGARWFSTFDLRSSYHQVAMEPDDADKTAFICREGQFKFKTMPFGLCNAGATFQRLMDMVMAGLAFDICLVYLDDVIVFSSTVEGHFERLRSVLSRLCNAGLKLKPSKCRLLQKHVSFLGHVVSEDGIGTDPEKVRAIMEWPTPINLREVRSFVGLCCYYRRFVRDFAKISSPLHAMTKKGEIFRWTDACQEAFQRLKDTLVSAPILAMPSDEGMFLLDTDASNHSVGAVLSQVQDGAEKVVAYASRKLSNAEVNYCVTRKELLAVVYFVKYFKHYLLGRRFTVRTDHAALQWLKRIPEPVGQQARWIGFLEEFEFDIVHHAGSRHLNADALSRRPCRLSYGCCAASSRPEDPGGPASHNNRKRRGRRRSPCVVHVVKEDEPCERITPRPQRGGKPVPPDAGTATSGEQSTHDVEDREPQEGANGPAVAQMTGADQQDSAKPGWTADDLAAAQHADLDIGPVLTKKLEGNEKPPWEEIANYSAATKTLWHQWDRLVVRDGVLYRRFYSLDGTTEFPQLVVPFGYRKDFCKLAHEGLTGGHMGRSRTEEQVKRRGYWPGWSDDVRRFVRACGPCAQYHRGPPPRQAHMTPMLVGEPFERVSIDITGPFPPSSKGNIFMLTVMDHFTKWAEAIPLRNHTAPTVARALMVHVFNRLGMPLQLLSDRGPEFEGKLFSELCHWMGIDKVRTTAYRPATNGMVERYHRTLNTILAKIINDDQRNWCEKVPIAAAAYRASVHEATGYTPNRLMLGREVCAPLDIVLGHPREEAQHYESADEFVQERQRVMREVYACVRGQLGVAASRRKRRYDIRAKPVEFKQGDLVWYYYPRRYLKRSPKWQKFYTGPYTILRVQPPSNAVIRRTKRSQPIFVHVDKLKPCRSTEDDRDVTEENVGAGDVEEATAPPDAGRPVRDRRPPAKLRDYVQ